MADTDTDYTLPAGFSNDIAGYESGNDPTAENPHYPTSQGGPLGPHQFTASTWMDFAQANPKYFAGMTPSQILAARTDPALSSAATNWYASVNAGVLKQAGVPVTAANLGISHALGGTGAARVLSLPNGTTLAQAFQKTDPGNAAAILKQNPQYANMTVGDLKDEYAPMNANTPETSPGTPPPATSPWEAQMGQQLTAGDSPLLTQQQGIPTLLRMQILSQIAPKPVAYANPFATGQTAWAKNIGVAAQPDQQQQALQRLALWRANNLIS